MYGIRYVIIAVGSPDDPAEEEDLDALADMIHRKTGLKAFGLSDNVACDGVTRAMARELGVALP